MKHKKILTYITINIIVLLVLSCKTYEGNMYTKCIELNDVFGEVYQENCYNGKVLEQSFYINLQGEKIEVCPSPEVEAKFFNSENQFHEFVENNLIWKTQKNATGFVIIALYIDEEANIIEKRILRSIEACPEFNESALELIDKMEIISPAVINNTYVKSIRIMSIQFN